MLIRYQNQKSFNYTKEKSVRYDSMRHVQKRPESKQKSGWLSFTPDPQVKVAGVHLAAAPQCLADATTATWIADTAFLLQEGREKQGTRRNKRVMRKGDVAFLWQCPLMAHPTPSHPPQIWCCQHPPHPQTSVSVMTSSSDTDGNIQTDFRLVGFEGERAASASSISLNCSNRI